MTAPTFYRLALTLPLLLPLVLVLLGDSALSALLFLSLAFGGVQYVVFAFALFLWIGRVDDPARIRRASYLAPILFIPVQCAGLAIYWSIAKLSNPELDGFWASLALSAVYALFVGYAYVVMVDGLYALFNKSLIKTAK